MHRRISYLPRTHVFTEEVCCLAYFLSRLIGVTLFCHALANVPQEVVNRVTALEATGRLSGVMDDRGKFIFVSEEEMAKVSGTCLSCHACIGCSIRPSV